MNYKRIVFFISLTMISLGLVVSGLSVKTASQTRPTDKEGTIMVANATISATLRGKTQSELKGRVSLHFEASAEDLKQGVINVRANRFRALQAELGAEYAKSHDFH